MKRFIGWEFQFENREFGIRWEGTPRDIVRCARESRYSLNEVGKHLQTQILRRNVCQCNITLRAAPRDQRPKGVVREIEDASKAGAIDRIRELLHEHRRLIEPGGELSRLPLGWAAWHGLDELIVALVATVAVLDEPEEYGMTPLQWAAANGQPRAVELLLDAGADGRVDNDLFWNAAHIAHFNGHEGVTQVLATRGFHWKGGGTQHVFKAMGIDLEAT